MSLIGFYSYNWLKTQLKNTAPCKKHPPRFRKEGVFNKKNLYKCAGKGVILHADRFLYSI